MRKIIVEGGTPLFGEVEIGGSKNAALPILFGGILTADVCVFSDLPRVSDVLDTLEILKFLGARISFAGNGDVRVDYRPMRSLMPPPALTGSIRGSTYLLGSMLARFGEVRFGGAGGCNFGARPIDQHLAGFAALGATVREMGDTVEVTAPNGLAGTGITLAMPSVGATANLLLAASAANGETVIHNAAAEPHVAALAAFLGAAGAHIEGIGTDTVRVFGNSPLHGCHFRIIPDMIEAGTYLCMGVAAGGTITVTNVIPEHLACALDHFHEMGVAVRTGEREITVAAPTGYRCADVVAAPYPAFPTDLHPQFAALFCVGGRAHGQGSVRETVFRSRFRYTEELRRMGADVRVRDDTVYVTPALLSPAVLTVPDLRGGAALLIAALAVKGRTELTSAGLLSRGYEHLGHKLRALGAKVKIY